MFLYRFVRRRQGHFPPPPPPPAENICSHDNPQTTFQISFIFDRFDGPTYKLTDWILFDFRRDNDLQFSRLNMEFAIYRPKDGPIATKPKSKHIISIELNDYRVCHDLEKWGVRIYWIVTVVTSNVGVSSTRLVYTDS